ncbi:hypothetical protein BC833DRAFT_617839 [Globomyces pollinis-pini]|nr:hypothetical protein BC833DRAFT_617839 [Globomyces pollinis-pini]
MTKTKRPKFRIVEKRVLSSTSTSPSLHDFTKGLTIFDVEPIDQDPTKDNDLLDRRLSDILSRYNVDNTNLVYDTKLHSDNYMWESLQSSKQSNQNYDIENKLTTSEQSSLVSFNTSLTSEKLELPISAIDNGVNDPQLTLAHIREKYGMDALNIDKLHDVNKLLITPEHHQNNKYIDQESISSKLKEIELKYLSRGATDLMSQNPNNTTLDGIRTFGFQKNLMPVKENDELASDLVREPPVPMEKPILESNCDETVSINSIAQPFINNWSILKSPILSVDDNIEFWVDHTSKMRQTTEFKDPNERSIDSRSLIISNGMADNLSDSINLPVDVSNISGIVNENQLPIPSNSNLMQSTNSCSSAQNQPFSVSFDLNNGDAASDHLTDSIQCKPQEKILTTVITDIEAISEQEVLELTVEEEKVPAIPIEDKRNSPTELDEEKKVFLNDEQDKFNVDTSSDNTATRMSPSFDVDSYEPHLSAEHLNSPYKGSDTLEKKSNQEVGLHNEMAREALEIDDLQIKNMKDKVIIEKVSTEMAVDSEVNSFNINNGTDCPIDNSVENIFDHTVANFKNTICSTTPEVDELTHRNISTQTEMHEQTYRESSEHIFNQLDHSIFNCNIKDAQLDWLYSQWLECLDQLRAIEVERKNMTSLI